MIYIFVYDYSDSFLDVVSRLNNRTKKKFGYYVQHLIILFIIVSSGYCFYELVKLSNMIKIIYNNIKNTNKI